MDLFVNRRIRIVPNEIIYVRRQLSSPGQILVSVGQEVTPAEIIGRSIISAGFRTLDLAKVLSVSSGEVLKYLKRPIGKKIFKGELLAFKKGGFLGGDKVILSPTDGLLESFDQKSGHLKITYLPHNVDLPAAVFGTVENVDKASLSVILKTQATRVYGLFGTGRSREGTLRILGGRSDLIGRTRLTQEVTSHILVIGGLIYAGAIAEAVSYGVHGIITGGINSSDYKSMSGGKLTFPSRFGSDIGLGLVVCEGFGSIPIGEDIYKVLLEYNNQFVIIDGNRGRITLPSCESNCLINIRKTALPKGSEEKFVEPFPEVEAVKLSPGQMVRIISSPYMGDQGEVSAIDKVPTMLESKIRTYLVTVTTKSRKVRVPYLNLEVIDTSFAPLSFRA